MALDIRARDVAWAEQLEKYRAGYRRTQEEIRQAKETQTQLREERRARSLQETRELYRKFLAWPQQNNIQPNQYTVGNWANDRYFKAFWKRLEYFIKTGGYFLESKPETLHTGRPAHTGRSLSSNKSVGALEGAETYWLERDPALVAVLRA